MENEHSEHRKRMMERLDKNGLSSFHDHEILEMLLYFALSREDTNPIAHRLLCDFNGISGVLKAETDALKTVKGVGEKSAHLISIVGEIARRSHISSKLGDRFRITNTKEAVNYCETLFLDKRYECFYAVCLDISGKVISDGFISEGIVDQVPAYTRKIVETALKYTAVSVILAHNHPGGKAHPSNHDDEVTDGARIALASVGIVLSDHIIIGENGYFSYAGTGKLKQEDFAHILEAAQSNNVLRSGNLKTPLE